MLGVDGHPQVGSAVHVAVDASALSGGSSFRGIGTYLRELLPRLDAQPGIRLTALDPLVAEPTGALRDVARQRTHRLAPARFAGIEHDLRIDSDIRRSRADVFWSPAQSPPKHCSRPWVQTLHDVTPLLASTPSDAREAAHWKRRGKRLRLAKSVMCPSFSSASQGIDLLGLDPDRVHVTPLGVGTQFSADPSITREPFFLVVSDWGPHKGFAEAFEVAAAVADAELDDRLVVVGAQSEFARRELENLRNQSRRPDRVEIRGWVENLPSLYRAAKCVLVSSRAEGFGLPILEAMACGTPVVSFDNTSLPEVVGDAGLLVADGNVKALASTLISVLRDARLTTQLREAGLRHAKKFSWDSTARLTSEILRSAIESP